MQTSRSLRVSSSNLVADIAPGPTVPALTTGAQGQWRSPVQDFNEFQVTQASLDLLRASKVSPSALEACLESWHPRAAQLRRSEICPQAIAVKHACPAGVWSTSVADKYNTLLRLISAGGASTTVAPSVPTVSAWSESRPTIFRSDPSLLSNSVAAPPSNHHRGANTEPGHNQWRPNHRLPRAESERVAGSAPQTQLSNTTANHGSIGSRSRSSFACHSPGSGLVCHAPCVPTETDRGGRRRAVAESVLRRLAHSQRPSTTNTLQRSDCRPGHCIDNGTEDDPARSTSGCAARLGLEPATDTTTRPLEGRESSPAQRSEYAIIPEGVKDTRGRFGFMIHYLYPSSQQHALMTLRVVTVISLLLGGVGVTINELTGSRMGMWIAAIPFAQLAWAYCVGCIRVPQMFECPFRHGFAPLVGLSLVTLQLSSVSSKPIWNTHGTHSKTEVAVLMPMMLLLALITNLWTRALFLGGGPAWASPLHAAAQPTPFVTARASSTSVRAAGSSSDSQQTGPDQNVMGLSFVVDMPQPVATSPPDSRPSATADTAEGWQP